MNPVSSVTVVLPIYRLNLTEDEAVSLAMCRKHLGNYNVCFAMPRSLPKPAWIEAHENHARFPDNYFSYPFGYNSLLMSSRFYQYFSNADYILIHQLDCLVLRDELGLWLVKEFDYVGAPWFDDYLSPGQKQWTVGNGGFSLRKVSSALKVLNLPIRRSELYPIPMPGHPQPAGRAWLVANIRRRLRQHLRLWTVEDELANCSENEDRFWSFVAPRLFSGFRIPEPELALRFAFETQPRECWAKTGGDLPFGCHAWSKVDREFWEDVLLREGSEHARGITRDLFLMDRAMRKPPPEVGAAGVEEGCAGVGSETTVPFPRQPFSKA